MRHRKSGCALKELAKSGGLSVDLASAFDASPNPYTLLTPDLRFAGMNRAYLDVTKQTREGLLGRHIMEAYDGAGDTANADQLRDSFERVLVTGEPHHIALLHYAIPLPDENGVWRNVDKYWSCTHSPVTDDDGQIRYILQHTTDVTELQLLRRQTRPVGAVAEPMSALDAIVSGRLLQRAEDIQASNRRLESERNRLVEMFMQAPGFMTVLSGPDHVFQLHNQAYAQLIGHRDIIGKPVRVALPEMEGQGFYEFLDGVFATGEPYEGRQSRIQIQQIPDAPLVEAWLNFIYQPIRDADGNVVGIFVQGHDVTSDMVAAERQKLMIDELNHRVKNTLATVQSIAMQTARTHADPRTFAEGFQARLIALSHTHDLLTRRHWEGADLRDVLLHETEAHGSTRVVLNGPAVILSPAAALSLGMIFHELATNAAKYGALSSGEGRVFVDWAVANQADRRLTLEWRELDGPPVVEPDRRGFGTRLIERNIRHDLAGEVKLQYPTDGFHAEMSVPLDRGSPT